MNASWRSCPPSAPPIRRISGEDYTLLILLDTIFARGQLSLKMEASQPGLSERYLRLRGARHPLLDKKKAVANDLELGDRFDTWSSPVPTPAARR